jgi:hypothetical protein
MWIALCIDQHGQFNAVARHLPNQIAEHAVRRYDFERSGSPFGLLWRGCRHRACRQQQTQNDYQTQPLCTQEEPSHIYSLSLTKFSTTVSANSK